MVNSFRGKYAFLSNFYNCNVVWEGKDYKNSEAAFQAGKSTNPFVRDVFRSMSGSQAKRHGRIINLRPDWEEVKLDIMYQVCYAKFTQNPELKLKLLATGDKYLEEGNTWGDKFWGAVNGVGKNNLGKILMRIRDELR
jgi:ribA/ribD-fused uncharacterized protein